MTGASLGLDLLLAVALPAIALVAVVRRDPLEAVMLLFAFGVLLALTWARLGAPDVAMVEAALGAGVTGALFLAAMGRIGLAGDTARRHALAWIGAVAGGAVALLPAALAVRGLPARFDGLSPAVHAAVPLTGATHPVTSVLLDFRGYDTLLEIAVLALAVLGSWSARGPSPAGAEAAPDPGAILLPTARMLLPPIVVVAGHLLWIGAAAPGGAFQAGTVLGTTLILAILTGAVRPRRLPAPLLRALVIFGFAVFLAVAAGAAVSNGSLLDYPPARAPQLVLGIEAALTVSIALVMAFLFEGSVPAGREGEAP